MSTDAMRTCWRHRHVIGAGLLCGLALAAIGVSGAAVRQEQEPGLLAFETPSGIYLIRADGTGLRRLPGTRAGDQNPAWSPDGRKLVFWTDKNSLGEIYVANADGSERRRLSRNGPNDVEPSDQFPAWSPDGRLIAFESLRSGSWHIWLMRSDGSGARRLTRDGRGGYSPQWAPDGKRIVYTTMWNQSSLGVVDLAGHTRALKTLSIDEDWGPSWSPDGSTIAFNSTVESPKSQIYVVDTNGGTPRRLTRNSATDSDPVWSPDGQLILFASGRAGLDEVYLMNSDGTDQRRVTRMPTEYACCSNWRPEP